MPLSSAERCRRYREKLKKENPEKFEEMKKRNAVRTKVKKRKISEMDEAEKIEVRKQWRDEKRKKKEKVPSVIDENQKARRRYRSQVDSENKKLKQKIVLLCRKNNNLRKMLLRYRKKINTLNIQLQDLKSNMILEKQSESSDLVTLPDDYGVVHAMQHANELTPLSKSNLFINEQLPYISGNDKEKVKQKLLQQHVLEDSLKETYKISKTFKERKILKNIINSKTAKKYKMKTNVLKCLGLKNSVKQNKTNKQKSICTAKNLKKFYLRDDVSRMTAGKKEYVTNKKIQKQKRLLLDTLRNLYIKYKNEGGTVSFTTFKRYRPFYVVAPSLKSRNTCACIKHSNLTFKVSSLKKVGLLETSDLNDLVSKIVCDTKSKSCIYSECMVCVNKTLIFDIPDNIQEVSWLECGYKTYEYEKDGQRKVTKKMVKEIKTGSVHTLVELIQSDLQKFKVHHFNIYHQYKNYKEAIENIEDNEVIIHCDFSENYVCKMAEEVQAMHFGASKTQVSLHTGLLYIKNEKPICFCTVSSSLKHGPEAIWGHMKPIIDFAKEKFPGINRVHFWSDGPATQYKQKNNFYLFCQKMKEEGFTQGTWSFFEASHGKGAADGVGGLVKRTLDARVAYGVDIVDAEAVFDILSKTVTSVKTFYVSESDIKNVKIPQPERIIPIPSTMKIHQVILTDKENLIKYRSLSCFCTRGNCECFDIKTHDLLKTKTSRVSKEKLNKNKRIQIKKTKINQELSSETETEIEYAESDNSDWDKAGCLDSPEDISFSEEEMQNIEHIPPPIEASNTTEPVFYKVKKTNRENKDRDEEGKEMTYKIGEEDIEQIKFIDKDDEKTSKNRNKEDKEMIQKIGKKYKEIIRKKDSLIEIGLDYDVSTERKNKIARLEKENANYPFSNPLPSTSGIGSLTKITDKRIEEILSRESSSNCTEDIEEDSFDSEIYKKPKTYGETSTQKLLERNEEKNEESTLDLSEIAENIMINDVVLVRYFIRKVWKYYVGFVKKIDAKDNNIFYSVTFLKTLKTPKLKFIMPKKPDLDIVTDISIVKKLRLSLNCKEYYLLDDFDEVYF